MLSSASGAMPNSGPYGNERTGTMDQDYGGDSASGGFFLSDFKKHDDLKEMLDSNKDNLKLEAMKRIIGMIAKGRDASILFPAVVKNVVSKNIEVKKLVYVYLERYAEEQQDLALLSISTFQRALKEPNQLIRAGALRVLSSIRVSMIAPIVMLAIRDASADMSPYVRKTAAHAIPKLYSLDPEQKPELILIIQKLLQDKTVLVIGSAVMAFTKVCPEREDLIHQVFRKLCALLVDVDEWGQVIIVNMLTRYARTQFTDPNIYEKGEPDKAFYESESDSSEKAPAPTLDPDHRLLLRSARPLLQSRNAAVVMAVAQLYHHVAPKSEGPIAARALVRLLRSHTEVQSIVLNAIASISFQNKGMFEPYLKSFFVRTSDPTRIKLLKLDILTNLATDSNISVILRELQTYISSSDKPFVAATIQAIGRCACSITEVTDSCLNGLVSLLSNRDEAVVAESVVVIKRLLQTQAADPKEIIIHMVRLLDNITVAQARAAILWLLGEHSKSVSYIAPDVLRKLAKTFPDEHDIVKLQVLNLAVKLFITNPEQTIKLCQYVFSLAKYDQNYDIRDRARLLKHFMQNDSGKITSQAIRIFLAPKPAPLLQSQFKDREQLQLGSLSHYINQRATGYEPLPDFAECAQPASLRDVEGAPPIKESKPLIGGTPQKESKKELTWESGSSSNEEEDESESESSSEQSDSGSESESSSENEEKSSSESTSEESETEESEPSSKTQKRPAAKPVEKAQRPPEKAQKIPEKTQKPPEKAQKPPEKTQKPPERAQKPPERAQKPPERAQKPSETVQTPPEKMEKPGVEKPVVEKPVSNLDLLLDLDSAFAVGPVLTPTMGGFLSSPPGLTQPLITLASPMIIPDRNYELLNKVSGRGMGLTYKFMRLPYLFTQNMLNIKLTFHNHNKRVEICDIRIGKKSLGPGMSIQEFNRLHPIYPGCTLVCNMGIDFNDSLSPASFELLSTYGSFDITIKAGVGDLLRPAAMSEEIFLIEQSKLKGMNEHTIVVGKPMTSETADIVYYNANVGPVLSASASTLRFAAQTYTSGTLVLVTIMAKEVDQMRLVVNCDKLVIGSMLLSELKIALK